MAFNVTILSIDDARERAKVEFEDTSSGTSVVMTAQIPEEWADESELLDYLATLWPHETFLQRGKAPVDRHVVGKDLIGTKKNITGRVQSP